jgi:hypothetical protein
MDMNIASFRKPVRKVFDSPILRFILRLKPI